MSEPPKIDTEAEKQVQRLETLRQQKEIVATKATRPPEPIRTAVEQTMERLEAMRARAQAQALAEAAAAEAQRKKQIASALEAKDAADEADRQGLLAADLEAKNAAAEMERERRFAAALRAQADAADAERQKQETAARDAESAAIEAERAKRFEAALKEIEEEPAPTPPVSTPEPVVTGADISTPVPALVPLENIIAPMPLPAVEPEAAPLADPVQTQEAISPQSDPATATVSLGHHAFPRFEGKYKNVKLTLAQMRMLEKLFDADHRLYPGRILRVALNLWMGLPNQIPEDKELEPLARRLLAGIRNTQGGILP
jgi:multidrug efflux pump subunit AcrA (membrane-fusion protein)